MAEKLELIKETTELFTKLPEDKKAMALGFAQGLMTAEEMKSESSKVEKAG